LPKLINIHSHPTNSNKPVFRVHNGQVHVHDGACSGSLSGVNKEFEVQHGPITAQDPPGGFPNGGTVFVFIRHGSPCTAHLSTHRDGADLPGMSAGSFYIRIGRAWTDAGAALVDARATAPDDATRRYAFTAATTGRTVLDTATAPGAFLAVASAYTQEPVLVVRFGVSVGGTAGAAGVRCMRPQTGHGIVSFAAGSTGGTDHYLAGANTDILEFITEGDASLSLVVEQVTETLE